MSILGNAVSGVRAQQNALDVLGDNLANMNTYGFKAERASFSETLNQVRHITQPAGEKTGQPLLVPSGVMTSGIVRTTTPGVVSDTDNPYSLAIQGDGYFQIRLPDQSMAYTRSGNFLRDADGQLVNEAGYALEPAVFIPADQDIYITADGRVVSEEEDGTTRELAQINLARFTNAGALQRIGDNLFLASGRTQMVTGAPGLVGLGTLIPGKIERSNVDLGQEMTDMIQVQRTYQANTRVIRNADEMWGVANAIRR
ncbi:MAG: flagellar hook-basal body complex protein [Peptococcaceae bacterium]|nr:flagellar hook-basal body complex protein [Peptococcaceae bacterium]